MRQILTILIALGFTVNLFATNLPTPDDVVAGLKKGDVSMLAKHFDSNVDVTLLGDSNTYSKSQATEVLKSFFAKNSVSNFKVIHNVDSKSGSSESIVGQITAGGKSYRVFILLANAGSKQIIQEISIKTR